MRCTCDRDNWTNRASSRISWNTTNVRRGRGWFLIEPEILVKGTRADTNCWPSGSLAAIFSNTFISSIAASLYFSTFLMIFRAITWSLKTSLHSVIRSSRARRERPSPETQFRTAGKASCARALPSGLYLKREEESLLRWFSFSRREFCMDLIRSRPCSSRMPWAGQSKTKCKAILLLRLLARHFVTVRRTAISDPAMTRDTCCVFGRDRDVEREGMWARKRTRITRT